MTTTASNLSPPTPPSPRFTLELEFVLSLSNPYYLSHLALTYPHLLNPPIKPNPNTKPSSQPSSTADPHSESESDASKFASYLSYLYNYWRKPEYARFLTHPGATLRNLELLQQEQFRRDIIRPDLIEKLLAAGSTDDADHGGEAAKEAQDGKEADAALASGDQEAAVKEEGGNTQDVREGTAVMVNAG